MRWGGWLWIGAAALLAPSPARAAWKDQVLFTLSARLRGESVAYFRPAEEAAPRGAHRYSFLGAQLRPGLRATTPHVQLVLEAQGTALLGVPSDATLPPPAGNLGPGAVYFSHTPHRDQASAFVKQASLTLRHSGLAATLGRFEVSDGIETTPGHPTLVWLKRSRIAERLVGPFGYTHGTRSFDGARIAWDTTSWNASAVWVRPTRGGYEIDAQGGLEGLRLGGLALTAKRLPLVTAGDARLFYLHFRDDRPFVVKTDNRPLAVRRADTQPVRVETGGAHVLTAATLGPGTADMLLWVALQSGDWGALRHRAWALAAEAGYELARLPASPWLRLGYDRSSGDDDPTDATHRTFFQLIPTPRIYAQFPFFNLMNSEDTFAQLVLRPHPRLAVRADYHVLRLSRSSDLWYAGGGATGQRVFGFSGTASGGGRSLARLLDLGVSLKLSARLSAYLYGARARGGAVVARTFAGANANYGYAELSFRY